MIKKIVLIGAGGHGKSCVEAIESSNEYVVEGFIDSNPDLKEISGYPVLGPDERIGQLAAEKDIFFLISVGQIKSSEQRKKIYDHIVRAGGKFATVISSNAIVSQRSTIGEGSIIMQQALINAGSSIGKNTIINNKCLIEHDCIIGDHNHISTGAIINGNCQLGNNVFVGSGSVLKNGISIGEGVIIGAGTVVNTSIEMPGIYLGNPARKLEEK